VLTQDFHLKFKSPLEKNIQISFLPLPPLHGQIIIHPLVAVHVDFINSGSGFWKSARRGIIEAGGSILEGVVPPARLEVGENSS